MDEKIQIKNKELADNLLSSSYGTCYYDGGTQITALNANSLNNDPLYYYSGTAPYTISSGTIHQPKPTSSDDPSGYTGETRFDGNFMYVKFSDGWKRTEFLKF